VRGELFRFYDIAAPGYTVLLFTGFLFATAAGAAWAKRVGQDPDVVVDLGLATLLLGVIGGKLLHVVADGYLTDYINLCLDPSKVDWRVDRGLCATKYKGVWDAAKGVCHPQEPDCFAWAKFWNPGYAYYGGFVFASAGAWILLKRDRFPFWKAADMAGFAIPIGLTFGRMGCLLAGCCFGTRSDSALALSFPPGSPASDAQAKLGVIKSAKVWSLPVHPTQIYEAALAVGIAAYCLLWLHGRKRYDGQVFVAFMALYAAGRFLLELLRADDRGALAGLSTSQLVGLVLLPLAWWLHKRLGGAAAATRPTPDRTAA
jgi:phosphatidylglycerol:prolipoprotein diacylglycerol transferase